MGGNDFRLREFDNFPLSMWGFTKRWGYIFPWERLILVLFFPVMVRAETPPYVYEYNPRLRQAYEAILRLNLEEGARLLDQELRENPQNLMTSFVADYQDCLELFLLGDPALLESREAILDSRIRRLSLGPENDPWQRMSRAAVHFRWALVYLRYGEQWKAGVQLRRSYILIRANRRDFPQFPQGVLFQGIEEALVGSLPSSYRWLEKILGLKGDGKGGLRKLSWFADQSRPGDLFHEEALLYLAYFQGYIQSDTAGLNAVLGREWFQREEQPLACLIRSDFLLNFQGAEEARKMLEPLVYSGRFTRFPIFEFMLAKAYMHGLDSRSRYYFQRFVERNKGVFFQREAMRNLSLLAFLDGNQNRADFWRARLRQYVHPSLIDADRRAERFAQEESWPHPDLLRIRWLLDGGYISKARRILEGMDPDQLPSPAHKLEYFYRKGRLLEHEGRWGPSLEAYALAIERGRDSKEQFGARAALQSARVYEKRGQFAQARIYYELCLRMKNHDFQNAIDQQAKAGLERLN